MLVFIIEFLIKKKKKENQMILIKSNLKSTHKTYISSIEKKNNLLRLNDHK